MSSSERVGPRQPKDSMDSNGERSRSKKNDGNNGKNKSNLAEKYKYVRFVEKKKVLRQMRQLQQSLMSGALNSSDEIESRLTDLRGDLLYIEKYPSTQKYISLFPSEGQLSEACQKKQREIRAMIINLSKRNSESAGKRSSYSVANDGFFASVDNMTKRSAIIATKATNLSHKGSTTTHSDRSIKDVHPSWEAKKTNDKLTGSIVGTRFEGSHLLFDDCE